MHEERDESIVKNNNNLLKTNDFKLVYMILHQLLRVIKINQ